LSRADRRMCALLLTRRGFGSVARIDIFLVVGLIALAVILSAVLFFIDARNAAEE